MPGPMLQIYLSLFVVYSGFGTAHAEELVSLRFTLPISASPWAGILHLARSHLDRDPFPAAEGIVGDAHSSAGLGYSAVGHGAQLGAAGRVVHREGGGGWEPAAAHEAVPAE